MNATTKELIALTAQAERAAAACRAADPDPYRMRFHLMPPTGWLNDPNGLCQVNGVFHAFFQYAPFNVQGGIKLWGHAVSRDLLTWEYLPAALFPDHPFDVTGAYSGSALVENGQMEIFYTGNVKREDADGYDYVLSGREAATVRARYDEATGLFCEKRLLMTNADYPADDTLHVRDPKVWKLSGAAAARAAARGVGPYLMVQGARRRGTLPEDRDHGGDCGEALVFSSPNKCAWKLASRVNTPERFGYMWECPDYFELPLGQGAAAEPEDAAAGSAALAGDAAADACAAASADKKNPVTGAASATDRDASCASGALQLLSVSPQGLVGAPWDALNRYQSGYFTLTGDVWDGANPCELGDFQLWDWGFDFYAPQTFEAEDGRRILIGWMGMPDEDAYGNDPTVARGWQHGFTVPREVFVRDGAVRTLPVREVARLRGEGSRAKDALAVEGAGARCCDVEVSAAGAAGTLGAFRMRIAGALDLAFDAAAEEFSLSFSNTARTAAGCGRTRRAAPLARLENVRVLVDASCAEVFVNDGALAFTTRLYPVAYGVEVEAPGAAIRFWPVR